MLVLYVLGLIGKLFNIPPLSSSYSLLIKIPAILADLALGLMVYHIAKINLKEKNENIILFLVLLNPVLILNSSFWGQIDSFFTLFLLISLYLLYQKKYISAVVLYSLCALIKPQAFIFAPVFLCGIIGTKDFKLILKSAGTSILTFFIVSFPFFGLRFDLLIDKYMQTLSSYSYASVNAYNIYALLGLNWIEIKGIFWLLWQIIVLAGITSFSIWFYIKAKGNDKIFYTAYLLIVLVFNLSTKMHERYIFPALLLIFICYLYKKDKRLLYLFLRKQQHSFLIRALSISTLFMMICKF